jgi:adenosylmethionine-8-amino-7-oxononanoate aminotransferase
MMTMPWFEAGKKHIWHPYTQMQITTEFLPVVGSDGVWLELADGRHLIDGVSSWWTACHGHRHPALMAALAKQAATLPHVMFAGLAHEPAYRLATRLCQIAPQGLERVFFVDSGSVAVEVAMKLALQYWQRRGKTGRTRFLSFTHAYHGDTLGTMALGGGFHAESAPCIVLQYQRDLPTNDVELAQLDQWLAVHMHEIAAIVIEPLLQGAGGMRLHTPEILAQIMDLARVHDILVIADEIATGFGRLGKTLFACEQAGRTPDIMTIGKGLTGGVIPLAATLVTAPIFEAFLSDSPEDAFCHGPTFMANPLACAVALASLDLFETEPRLIQVAAIEEQLKRELAPARNHPRVTDLRIQGAMAAICFDHLSYDEEDHIEQHCVSQGVWLRPMNHVFYTMPPFVTTPGELTQIIQAMLAALVHVS